MTARPVTALIGRVRRGPRPIERWDADLIFQLSRELGVTLAPLPDGRLHLEGDRDAVLFLARALKAHKPALRRGACRRCGSIATPNLTPVKAGQAGGHTRQRSGLYAMPTVQPQYMVSPLNGARCPIGAHPGNTGGKKGRSGRKPCRVKAARRLSGSQKLSALQAILDGPRNPTEWMKALDLLERYAYGPTGVKEVRSSISINKDSPVSWLREIPWKNRG